MFIEYEATFINLDKDEMRERLTKFAFLFARLVKNHKNSTKNQD